MSGNQFYKGHTWLLAQRDPYKNKHRFYLNIYIFANRVLVRAPAAIAAYLPLLLL